MRVRTDDEVYRVDAVWLGPPRATFPFRARYVSWGIGVALFLLIMSVQRQLGIGFGFFSTAWAIAGAIALAKLIGSRINHERPLLSVMTMWLRELKTPREQFTGVGGAAGAARVRVKPYRPRKINTKRFQKQQLKAHKQQQRHKRPDSRYQEVRDVRTKA